MIRTATAFILSGLLATPVAAAQGNGRKQGRVPPGHLPPAGACRVWYEGVPPGHQPPPTSCAQAERDAARDSRARVIYGSDSRRGRDTGIWRDEPGVWRDDTGVWRDDEGRRDRGRVNPRTERDRGRAVPRIGTIPGTRNGRTGGIVGTAAYDKGYEDGRGKGREDARDGDDYSPNRHSWYRSADRGYNSRDGSKDQYAETYRRGFRAGYDEAYRLGR